MAALSKFTFATDFAVREDPDAKPEFDRRTVLAREEAAYAKGRAEGLEEGFAKGQATMREEMLSSFEKEMADTLGQLVSSAELCLQELETEVSHHHGAMMHLAMTVARKLAGAALEKFGYGNVEAMIRMTLKELASAPHIVLRVSAGTAATLEGRIKALKAETGFQGQIIILPEEDMLDADCRIEWADGALMQSRRAIETEVDRLLAAAMGGNAESTDQGAPAPDTHDEEGY